MFRHSFILSCSNGSTFFSTPMSFSHSAHSKAAKDASVKAIVIIGANNKFIAGADISMLQHNQNTSYFIVIFPRNCTPSHHDPRC